MSHAEIRESCGAAREMHTTQDALEGEDDDSRQLLDLLQNYTQIPGVCLCVCVFVWGLCGWI